MSSVRAKKHLGQHFLTDKNIANKIVDSLKSDAKIVLEVGPGMGILSDLLFLKEEFKTYLVDIDEESIEFLKRKYKDKSDQIIFGDFLKLDFASITNDPIAIIGNFPYNISSQIIFKILESRTQIPEMVGMFQKEVAERIAAPPGNKEYGIMSVFVQTFFTVEYLFTVNPGVFNPPPKVKSAVIRIARKENFTLPCNEKMFFRIVKDGFNQRRKTLRNGLRQYLKPSIMDNPVFDLRAERLSFQDFIDLTLLIENAE